MIAEGTSRASSGPSTGPNTLHLRRSRGERQDAARNRDNRTADGQAKTATDCGRRGGCGRQNASTVRPTVRPRAIGLARAREWRGTNQDRAVAQPRLLYARDATGARTLPVAREQRAVHGGHAADPQGTDAAVGVGIVERSPRLPPVSPTRTGTKRKLLSRRWLLPAVLRADGLAVTGKVVGHHVWRLASSPNPRATHDGRGPATRSRQRARRGATKRSPALPWAGRARRGGGNVTGLPGPPGSACSFRHGYLRRWMPDGLQGGSAGR